MSCKIEETTEYLLGFNQGIGITFELFKKFLGFPEEDGKENPDILEVIQEIQGNIDVYKMQLEEKLKKNTFLYAKLNMKNIKHIFEKYQSSIGLTSEQKAIIECIDCLLVEDYSRDIFFKILEETM